MKLPMYTVIFVDDVSYEFMSKLYPESDKRKYIIKPFEKFEMATFNWDFDQEIDPEKYHNKFLYMIWNEKIFFVRDVARRNPFNSQLFVWTDIGSFRRKEFLQQFAKFPEPCMIHAGKVQMALRHNFTDEERRNVFSIDNRFIYVHRISAAIISFPKMLIETIAMLYKSLLYQFDSMKVFKGKDQNVLGFLALQNPDLIDLLLPLDEDSYRYDHWFYLHDYLSPTKSVALIGPGIMSIPPKAWGAVEILIWEYAQILKSSGFAVKIYNTSSLDEIVNDIIQKRYYLVHIHYDNFFRICEKISKYVDIIALTSHYGYLGNINRWEPHYRDVFLDEKRQGNLPNVFHFVLSEQIRKVYVEQGISSHKLAVIPNGVNVDAFVYYETPAYPDASIYLAKIDYRKRQYLFQDISKLYFAGMIADNRFQRTNTNYLGEWDKFHLYKNLSNYGNLVLLSDGEADPLVTKEALICGLGLVLSEFASANLDITLPFIDIISEDKIHDIDFVARIIDKNRSYAVTHRNDIRNYGLTLSWKIHVNTYIDKVDKLQSQISSLQNTQCDILSNRVTYRELDIFKTFKQIIIWGYKLHTHTHSYIHASWVKVFEYLGCKTYWFYDDNFPVDMDYSHSCFITEGWADMKIPLNATCTYFVHIARNPAKYLDIGARLIDIRFNVSELHDYNYDFKMSDTPVYLSPDTVYDISPDDSAVARKGGRDTIMQKSYEVVYMYWATDLLPHEFNYNDATIQHEDTIYYIASISETNPFHKFEQHVTSMGRKVVHIDPWNTPLSFEDCKKLMQKSYCCPDFRGPGNFDKLLRDGPYNGSNHLEIGYIPCRVFKAISYGHTGITNSKRVKQVLGNHVEYVADVTDVLDIVEKRKNDVTWRQTAMKYIAENHTYLQRARDLARCLNISHVTTCVTALYDIGRAAKDDRGIKKYEKWLLQTLTHVDQPFIIFLDPKLNLKDTILQNRKYGFTQIIEVALTDLEMWKYREDVISILTDSNYRSQLKHPHDLTNNLPEYTLVNHNKFFWLEKAIDTNPFSSKQFVWLDAGISRFFPSEEEIYTITRTIEDKFYLQGIIPSKLNLDTYISSNECLLKAGILMMGPNALKEVKKEVLRIWTEEMLAKRRVDNEQITLAVAYSKCASYIHVVAENYTPCGNIFDFVFARS